MSRSYALFLGCYIPALQPFAEAALRQMAPRLKINLLDIEGATCCPVPEIVRLADYNAWLYVSARNLALADSTGKDVMVVCNGCWETLHEAREALQNDSDLKTEINSKLKPLGKEFTGSAEVKHFLEVIVEDIGLKALKTAISKPLANLNVAIQYGCKLYKSPKEQLVSYFDEIISALDVNIVNYGAERLCCGFPLSLYSLDAAMQDRAKFKLDKIMTTDADCLVTACPGCYDVLEKAQLLLKRQGTRYDLPMLNLMEVMALALGFKPQEIGLDKHRIKTDALIKKLGLKVD